MSEEKAGELGLKPMARIGRWPSPGSTRGDGHRPRPGDRKRPRGRGLTLDQIDCIEFNEAFAVQVLSVLKLLGLSEEKVNTRGGAIAIGHPLGASGAGSRPPSAPDARPGREIGLATMCIGQGQGMATIFESMRVVTRSPITSTLWSRDLQYLNLSRCTGRSAEQFGPRPALRFKQNGRFQDLSWSTIRRQVDEVAAGSDRSRDRQRAIGWRSFPRTVTSG